MNFANKVSLFRILSVPFFIACLIYYCASKEYLRSVALCIFILAVISDAVDGYIARRAKLQSKAGLVLDPLGDKLLLMSAFILLSFDKFAVKFPLWVTLLVLSRDMFILLGAVVVYIVRQDINVTPSRWGKFTTIFQMLSVIAVLMQFKFSFLLWWPAVIFTVISGSGYIRRGFKALYALDNPRNNP